MESTLTKNQRKTQTRLYTEGGKQYSIKVTLRYDDQCGNGHNTFSITADIDQKAGNGRWVEDSGGCLHEEIAKHFPEFAHLIKWHLCSSDGPMHYLANTIYHASNRDYNGLLAGEFRQHTSLGSQNNGVPGVPNWELRIPKDIKTDVYADEKPAPITLEWQPYGITGQGKDRNFDAARNSAIWPEATDEQLSADPETLKAALLERLPALLQAFKHDMEEQGFIF